MLAASSWDAEVSRSCNNTSCFFPQPTRSATSSGAGVLCTGYIASVYAELREVERSEQVPHSYTTARTLLSILRLAQALARLRFERAVAQVWAQLC